MKFGLWRALKVAGRPSDLPPRYVLTFRNLDSGYTDYTQYLQYIMRNAEYVSGGTDTAKGLNAVNNEDLRTSQNLGWGSDLLISLCV